MSDGPLRGAPRLRGVRVGHGLVLARNPEAVDGVECVVTFVGTLDDGVEVAFDMVPPDARAVAAALLDSANKADRREGLT